MSAFVRAARCFAATCLVGTSWAALGADYQSVGNDPAILYDAPTLRGTKTAIAPRGMPVEIIVMQGDWVRIRDSAGGLAWIEKKSLVPKRTLVATDPAPVDVHASPDDASPIVFRVQPGVLLDVASPAVAGWVGVRHRDGQSGFVHVGSVWGA
jgi:hypothetical protein